MDALQTFVNHFIFLIGSKRTMREATRLILEKMISYEVHVLTAAQQLQARKNIGIDLMFKTGQREFLTKGVHNITFTEAFSAAYVVLPYGSTGAASFAPIITDVSHLDYFTVKMPVDGYINWMACLVTET